MLKSIKQDGFDGSPIEKSNVSKAGIIMREYGRIDDTIYQEGKQLKKLGITNFKSLFRKISMIYKRVYNLKNFGQRLDKHPEGNVLKHTITVVNRSIKEDDIDIGSNATMFHDIGKDETNGIHPKKGHITHYGHEKVSKLSKQI